MTRAPITYNQRRDSAPAAGFSVETPTAGFYRFRLVRGGHPIAVKIWHGPPREPWTGEEMDRAWRWQATANGEPIDLDRVWPACGREPISESDAAYLMGLQAWAAMNAPDSPQANPRQAINLITAPLPF